MLIEDHGTVWAKRRATSGPITSLVNVTTSGDGVRPYLWIEWLLCRDDLDGPFDEFAVDERRRRRGPGRRRGVAENVGLARDLHDHREVPRPLPTDPQLLI